MKDPMHKCGSLILSTGTLLCCVEFKGHLKPVEVTFCKHLEHNISKRVTLRDLILSMYILRTELRKSILLEAVRGRMWSKTTRYFGRGGQRLSKVIGGEVGNPLQPLANTISRETNDGFFPYLVYRFVIICLNPV